MAVFKPGQRMVLVRDCRPQFVGQLATFIRYQYFPEGIKAFTRDGVSGYTRRALNCLCRFDFEPGDVHDNTNRFEPLVPELTEEQMRHFELEPIEEAEHV